MSRYKYAHHTTKWISHTYYILSNCTTWKWHSQYSKSIFYSVLYAKSLDDPLPQRTKPGISPTILRSSNNLPEIHLYNCIHSWQSLCGNWNWPSGGRELRRVVARESFLACWTSIASRTIFIVFTVEAFLEASPVSNAEPLLHSLPLLLSVAPLSRSLCKKVSSGGTAVLDLSERASERSNWF